MKPTKGELKKDPKEYLKQIIEFWDDKHLGIYIEDLRKEARQDALEEIKRIIDNDLLFGNFLEVNEFSARNILLDLKQKIKELEE